jgi:excisionase family DNA binding protein
MAESQDPVAQTSEAADRQLFTVKEAAAYLSVSQATIYRWMKDGTLSFHKIGKALRFAREGLDAVVEKTVGQKEAEAAAGRCASCGHNVLVGGHLQGTGRLYFRPEKTRFWTFLEAMVPLKVRVCAACGYIQLHADTDRLTRLMPDGGETGSDPVSGGNGV